MKVLFVGLGSIGSRHLKNLSAYCGNNQIDLTVHALRYTDKPLSEDIRSLVSWSFSTVPEYEYYDVAFITNPTYLHAGTIKLLAGKVGTFFIEKPIFEHSGYKLEDLGFKSGQKAYVAAPMRWTGVYLELKKILADSDVFSVRSICSSYLPGWRPGMDYRENYSAKQAMGGGVTLDLIHEWDYICDLFGYPQKCINMRGKFSKLEIDSDDLSVYIARYNDFLVEIHLDYFGRRYRRNVEVFTAEGSIKADFGTGNITLADGSLVKCEEDGNVRYEREMEYFINYALGSERLSLNSPENALEILKIATGEKRSD